MRKFEVIIAIEDTVRCIADVLGLLTRDGWKVLVIAPNFNIRKSLTDQLLSLEGKKYLY